MYLKDSEGRAVYYRPPMFSGELIKLPITKGLIQYHHQEIALLRHEIEELRKLVKGDKR